MLRDPRQVADELVTLRRQHGVRYAVLADAGFNSPLDHAKALLEAIIEARADVGLTAVFEPGEVDAEFARLFSRAGGRAIMIFAMSLSEAVLAANLKPFQLEDMMKGADLLNRAGVGNFLYLTFGGPGETPATVEESLSNIALTSLSTPSSTTAIASNRGPAFIRSPWPRAPFRQTIAALRPYSTTRRKPPAMLAPEALQQSIWDSLRGILPMARIAWDRRP